MAKGIGALRQDTIEPYICASHECCRCASKFLFTEAVKPVVLAMELESLAHLECLGGGVSGVRV